MGNNQSAPAPRRPPNKLSKPRTNNNSTTNLLNTRAPPATSRRNSQSNNGAVVTNRYSTLSLDAVVGEVAEKPREEPPRKRMSLFRSKSSQPKLQDLEIDTGIERDFVDPSPVDKPVLRWSRSERSNSVAFELSADQLFCTPPVESRPPIRTARASLQHVPYSQHHPRLSLVAEAPSPRPEMAEELKRLSNYAADIDSPKNSSTVIPRTNSDTQLYGPIRRRSLLQHGIATRNSLVESDPRQYFPSQMQSRETPSREDLQNYYYNPAKPTSSPLSDLAALGRNLDDLPTERTQTPNDLEYGHIGVYKLGSLRITNGAASPSPSVDRPTTSGAEEDHLPARDGRVIAEGFHRQGISKRSNTFNVPTDTRKPPWITPAESPLRQTHSELETFSELEAFEPLTLTIDTQLPFPDPTFAQFNFFRNTESPTKSLDLAREYMQDLALSPFSFDNSPPPSPRLVVNSKHTAMEDDLFEPEPGTPPPEANEHIPRSFDSGYGGFSKSQGKAPLGQLELTSKPLAKADSGYSSNVSLRSFKSRGAPPAVPTKEAPPTPPKEALSRAPVSRVASSAYSVASDASAVSEMTIRTKMTLPALPAEDSMPTQPLRVAPPVPSKTPEQTWNAAQGKSCIEVRPQRERHQSMPPVPVHKAVRDIYVPADDCSHSPSSSEVSIPSSNDSSSRWRGAKKRPQSLQPLQPVFTVQAVRPNSPVSSIPPVSKEVSRKLEERVDGFPVTCFPNTMRAENGIHRTVSRETLGTIFSVGSAEFRDEPTYARLQSALPPVPEPSVPEQKPDFNRRHTYQIPAPLPSLGPPTARQTPKRKSLQAQAIAGPQIQTLPLTNADFKPHLTSYDNISSSLGESPYDLALSASKPEPTPFVPQSVPSASSRAKSMTSQLEADAAKRFALARRESQDQVVQPRRSYDRSVSQETLSTALQSRKSYDSVSNGNPPTPDVGKPYVPTQAARGHMRTSSRECPPAHEKFSSPSLNARRPFPMLPSQSSASFFTQSQTSIFNRSLENLAAVDKDEDDNRRLSMLSRASQGSRVKSPPPVSMQTQRKLTPSNLGTQQFVPPSRTPPMAPEMTAQAPNRTAPAPPHQIQPVPSIGYGNASGREVQEYEQSRYSEKEVFDPWANQRDFWASCRQSAGEALQTRRSLEFQRPESARPSFEYQRPALQQHSSYDYVAAQSRENEVRFVRRPESAMASYDQGRSDFEYQYQEQSLSHHESFDHSQQGGSQRYSAFGSGYDYPGRDTREPGFFNRVEGGAYNHTYGSHNKENVYSRAESQEYYNGPSQDDLDFEEQQHLPQAIHRNSTEDMLVLDRYAGGLGYGYEPGYGLGGSAGTRNTGKMAAGGRKSVDVSMQYGVDFSDVPVFLQRVKVEG